ncbi:hypothetical protein EVAR_46964_1 [Eumeta japonica]|uniref:Uncharacterized protein n=1 Tax=Eumeta variegata TaxID=151549 RepID=A0A4C1YIT8_EUMVA|nr:hypothetical protein EVAR_46964_1 [Eumeta japonica]
MSSSLFGKASPLSGRRLRQNRTRFEVDAFDRWAVAVVEPFDPRFKIPAGQPSQVRRPRLVVVGRITSGLVIHKRGFGLGKSPRIICIPEASRGDKCAAPAHQ